eukprot:763563-Hanusia_phi.AAC.5
MTKATNVSVKSLEATESILTPSVSSSLPPQLSPACARASPSPPLLLYISLSCRAADDRYFTLQRWLSDRYSATQADAAPGATCTEGGGKMREAMQRRAMGGREVMGTENKQHTSSTTCTRLAGTARTAPVRSRPLPRSPAGPHQRGEICCIRDSVGISRGGESSTPRGIFHHDPLRSTLIFRAGLKTSPVHAPWGRAVILELEPTWPRAVASMRVTGAGPSRTWRHRHSMEAIIEVHP